MAIRIGEDLLSCVNQSSDFNPTTLKDNIWLDSANNQLKTYKGAVKFEQTTRLIPENKNFSELRYLHVGASGTNPSWKTFTDSTSITMSGKNSFTIDSVQSIRLADCLFYVTGKLTGKADSTNKTAHINFAQLDKIDGSKLSISDKTKETNGVGTIRMDSGGRSRCGTITCDSGGGCYIIWTDNNGYFSSSSQGTYYFQMFITFNNSAVAHGKQL